MSNDTTQDLITRIKNAETIPDSGAAYSDSVLLEYLDQSLKGFIVPAIQSVMEEYFVVSMDTQMPAISSYPAGTPPTNVGNVVMIPGESTGFRLRDLYIVGTDGSFYNLPRLTPTQAASQSFGSPWAPAVTTSNANQFLGGFYLQGNQVQIYPYGLASQKIVRITYHRAPADLCLTSAAGQVIAVTGDVVTLDKVLPWYGSAQVSSNLVTYINAVSGSLPHDYVQNATKSTTVYASYAPMMNLPLLNVTGNTVTLPAGTGANVQIGDWICPAGQSVFAMNIPKEILPALVQKAASKCVHAAGDAEGYKIAQTEYVEMMRMALLMITPRVEGKPIKVLPTNSPFKASRGSNWGRF